MQFTTDTTLLKEALNQLRPALHTRTVLPVLECVKIETTKKQATLTLTNLGLTITTTLKVNNATPGTMLVPYQKLKDILQLYGSTPMQLSTTQNTIALTIDADQYNLGKAEDVDAFPNIPVVDSEAFHVPAEVMQAIITASACASTDVLRLNVCGVLVEVEGDQLNIVATDAHTMYKHTFTISNKPAWLTNAQVIVPIEHIKALHSIQDCTIAYNDKNIVFTTETTTTTITRIDASYPDYRAVIPPFNQNTEVEASALVLGTTRAMVAANKIDNGVNIDVTPDKITLHTNDIEFNQSANVVIDCNGTVVDIKMAFNGRFMLRTIQQLTTNDKTGNLLLSLPDNPNRAIVIKKEGTENALALVMPIMCQQ